MRNLLSALASKPTPSVSAVMPSSLQSHSSRLPSAQASFFVLLLKFNVLIFDLFSLLGCKETSDALFDFDFESGRL